jgi:competence protein ComEA
MKGSSVSIGIAACLLIASRLMTAAPAGQGAAQQPAGAAPAPQSSGAVTDDPTYELFSQTCSKCHDAARITAVRRTKSEWEDVLTKMIEKGATGSEEDFQNVFGFLRRHYGKVYINTAPLEEITTTLGLSPKDAEAIVAYRKANGSFKELEDVRKVPDVDLKTLDAHKDAVVF